MYITFASNMQVYMYELIDCLHVLYMYMYMYVYSTCMSHVNNEAAL